MPPKFDPAAVHTGLFALEKTVPMFKLSFADAYIISCDHSLI